MKKKISDGAVYIRVGKGKVDTTEELVDGQLLVDFDSEGKVFGLRNSCERRHNQD